MALPLALVIAQLQAFYGYTGVTAGTEVLVSADLAAGTEPQGSDLHGPGLTVNGPPLYFPSLRQLVWRVVPTAAGPQVLQLGVNGVEYAKTLVVGDDVARRSPLRPGPSLTDQFLEPSEAPLDGGGPRPGDSRAYPERTLRVLGFEMHWLVWFLVTSFAFVLVLRKPLGVVIRRGSGPRPVPLGSSKCDF